jgi:hypothetical protein
MSEHDDVRLLLTEEATAAESGRDIEGPLVRNHRKTKDPAQVYSLRIPVDRLEELRQLAASRDLAPSALMRRWVIERLDLELEHRSAVADRRAEIVAERPDDELVVFTRDEIARIIAATLGYASDRQAALFEEFARKAIADRNAAAHADVSESATSQ